MENILAARLKGLREKTNRTQKEIAKLFGLTNYQLSRYESGISNPDPDLIKRFADYYDVTTDYLLGRSNNPESNISNEDKEFEAFANDPSLQKWYKELPESNEEDLRRLRKMWEILKENGNI